MSSPPIQLTLFAPKMRLISVHEDNLQILHPKVSRNVGLETTNVLTVAFALSRTRAPERSMAAGYGTSFCVYNSTS
jgi:hypothetical protein